MELFRERGSSFPFTTTEIRQIAQIVDTRLIGVDQSSLDRLTPENLSELLEVFISNKKSEYRERAASMWNGLSSIELVALKTGAQSQYHAIQCSINGSEMNRCCLAEIQSKTVPEVADEQERLQKYFEVEMEADEILSNCFKIDIAGRLGDRKKDNKFYEQQASQFSTLIPQLFAILEKYKELHTEIAEQDSSIDLTEIVAHMEKLQGLVPESFDESKELFYKEICERLARIIFLEWHTVLKKSACRIADRIWAVEFAQEKTHRRREEIAQKFVDSPDKDIILFCFDHGTFKEVKEREWDRQLTLSIQVSPVAVEHLLSNPSILECPVIHEVANRSQRLWEYTKSQAEYFGIAQAG